MTKFTFAASKEGFDNHIDTSVRGYSQLWGDILSLSKYFVEDYTQVVDLGCSSGKLLKGMIEQNQKHIPHAQYTGIEIEEDFLVIIRMMKISIINYLILEVMLESLIFKTVL